MPIVLIAGGTGLIGKNLTRHLTANGYKVIILSRKQSLPSADPLVSYAEWNVKEQKIDTAAIGKADYIINLAGAGLMEKSWSEKYKKEIIESRIKSSGLLVKALEANPNNVKAIISASAIGWYGSFPQPLQKDGFRETDPPAEDFLGETCRLWEESIEPVTGLGKRLVKLRIGIVLSNEGAAFAEFKKPLRFGIATILRDGKQMLSWIHIDDLCRMFIYAIENHQLSGSYNAVAPMPVNNKDLMLKLAKLIRGAFYIPVHVPGFLLKIVLGERSIEVLKSAIVSCEKIKSTGFTFLYPSIDQALQELTGNKR